MTHKQARSFLKGQLEAYLKGKGIRIHKPFRCLNPQHEDEHPSMRYDRRRQKVHCFACGADYDTLDLIGMEHGLTGRDLFFKAYELFGIAPESEQGGVVREDFSSQSFFLKGRSHASPGDCLAFYQEAQRHLGQTDYLRRRGIGEEVAKRFMLGYVQAWRHPKTPQAPASPRLIIPTSPHSYLARDTRAVLTDAQKRYSKSKVGGVRIFNAEALRGATRPIFIVEGELDALSVIEAGGEAVAMGSAGNVRMLVEAVEASGPRAPLLLALDNDAAGEKAAGALEEALRERGILFDRVNPYGGYKDANEALLADREALGAAIARAEGAENRALREARAAYERTSVAGYLPGFTDRLAQGVGTACVPTGFQGLDEALGGGLYEGLYVVGAMSSLGKTTLLLQAADQVAQRGTDVLFFSLEMARRELIAKSLSRHTLLRVLRGEGDLGYAKTARALGGGRAACSDAERTWIDGAVREYEGYAHRVYVVEGAGRMGVGQVREAVERHIRLTGNRPAVFVDYLQILAPHSERTTDKQNTDRAVMELKRVSRDCGIPVVAISSLNRQSYKDAVTMEAFKESGAVEYSSDVLIGLQLVGAGGRDFDAAAEKKKNPRQVELVILKNRHGAMGAKVPLAYYAAFNYFGERKSGL